MSKILSQDEIDALLASSMAAASERPNEPMDAASLSDAVSYNFRRPDRVSKDQLRSLHFLHDRFALNVSTSLSAFLRAMTEVSIVSVEQFAYSEFLMSLPDPTAFYAINLSLYDGVGALEINPSVAYTVVDRLLGGSGQTPGPNRALTLIDLVENKLSTMLVYDREDARELAILENARRELVGLRGSGSRASGQVVAFAGQTASRRVAASA